MNLDDLYQEIILDHNAHPCHYGDLPAANLRARGFNPICGDEVVVEIELNKQIIKNISFHGQSCAIAKASASIMTTVVQNKSLDTALNMAKSFQVFATGRDKQINFANADILALGGISHYPSRVKCATLAWHALVAALTNHSSVKTEPDYEIR